MIPMTTEVYEQLQEQREQVLYLLHELGFDTTCLQGSAHNSELPFDDVIVVQELQRQLSRLCNVAA